MVQKVTIIYIENNKFLQKKKKIVINDFATIIG